MRLGGPIEATFSDPQAWAAAVKALGYRAAYCPVSIDSDLVTADAFAASARESDIVIAEVGVWNSPLASDLSVANEALDRCIRSLYLADRIGARCCVNIAGSRGAKWDGPDPLDYKRDTFDMVVESVRKIIDSVKPVRSFYTLEPMPWMIPDSVESYLKLIAAVDRKAFAVHLDTVNLINSPSRYFADTELIRDCVARLGPHIRSVHIKDIILENRLTVHLNEVRPGLGKHDLPTLLSELSRLDPELPIMLEHLKSQEEYGLAAEHVRAVAVAAGVYL